MKRLICLLIIVVLLMSCGQNSSTEVETVTVQEQKTIVVPDSLYKIVSEKENVNPKLGINKCNIEIELKHKISKEELTALANKLREIRKSYDNLWIFYNLPGKQAGSAAWATTHFTPNLKVEILGASDQEEKVMNEASVDGTIIGKWQDTRPLAECTMIIYKKGNKIFMKSTYGDGSSSDDEFIKKNYKGKIRYEQKVNKHSEYFLIEGNGNLGMYGNDGKFGEAIKKN